MAARILIADDQPDSAELLAVLLRFHGYEVQRVFDGLAALATARAWRPDLLLLDEQMPGMNGTSVCRALRDHPDTARSRVVLFSCIDEQDVPWQEAGAAAFLRKPLDIRALPALVARLLRELEDADGGAAGAAGEGSGERAGGSAGVDAGAGAGGSLELSAACVA